MKPSIPRGTRDFSPSDMQKRNYILNCIRKNFELFGFQQIETPAMENISTLTGKYGDEGDKLIFKILNSGNPFSEFGAEDVKMITSLIMRNLKSRFTTEEVAALNPQELQREIDKTKNIVVEKLTEKALRYDLTVPFARYVVMNQNEITFPFRRYQIQPVWRADRPQKGRYREFYQCDADIIGSNSLINELDLIALIDTSFSELKVPVTLKINNRKILAGIAEIIGAPEKIIDVTVAIDKLDKIGIDGVNKELREKNLFEETITKLQPFINFSVVDFDEKHLPAFKQFFEGKSEVGMKGYEELNEILKGLKSQILNLKLELDITLARGLNYYTGTIFEVKANAGTFTPSILGGGRYDDLTGIFGLPNMSGVGISFGIDRICDVMEELNLFPESISKAPSSTLLFTHFDEASQSHCLQLATELRKQTISCEVYPDITKKIAKQFDYANKKNIPFVCTVGSNEMEKQVYSIKNMSSGEKQELNLQDMINYLKNELK